MLSGWIIPSSANALWSIFALLVVAMVTLLGYAIKTWPLVKARLTEGKLADDQIYGGQYTRLLEWCDRLDIRVAALEKEIETCHAERDTARAEVLKWKAVAEGVGMNRQDEAAAMARKRMKNKQDDGGEDSSGGR